MWEYVSEDNMQKQRRGNQASFLETVPSDLGQKRSNQAQSYSLTISQYIGHRSEIGGN